MSGSIVRGTLGAATFLLGTLVLAADPPATESLPAPRPVNPPVPLMPAPPIYRLYSPPLSRDVWRLYDVGNNGFWRPRVIVSPYGDYYLYNHAAYPWAQQHPQNYKPRVVTE
jgi:hypothetical protein